MCVLRFYYLRVVEVWTKPRSELLRINRRQDLHGCTCIHYTTRRLSKEGQSPLKLRLSKEGQSPLKLKGEYVQFFTCLSQDGWMGGWMSKHLLEICNIIITYCVYYIIILS